MQCETMLSQPSNIAKYYLTATINSVGN